MYNKVQIEILSNLKEMYYFVQKFAIGTLKNIYNVQSKNSSTLC